MVTLMSGFKDIIAFSGLSIGLIAIGAVILYITGSWGSMIVLFITLTSFMFIPMMSVFIVDSLITKRGIKSYGLRVFKFHIIAFLLALLYPWLVVLIGGILAMLLGIPVDFGMSIVFSGLQKASKTYGISYETLLVSFFIGLIMAPFINTIPAFGEEIGWRGFLLDRLIEEVGALKAILISGIIWGIWHYPLILLFGYNYTYDTRFVGAIIFLLFTVSLGIFLSWLKIVTKNVLYPALAHGAVNAYIGYGSFIVLTDRIIGFPAGIIPSAICMILGLPFMLNIIHGAKLCEGKASSSEQRAPS